MKKYFLLFCFCFASMVNCRADRIYIMNSPGYNTAEPQLISAITSNGHTVVVNSTTFSSLPVGFTSTCVDPVNGYDWLCFFGNNSFTGLLSQVQNFIDAGGKVFYQYEVTCCTVSSSSVATLLSGLTGLTITPNINPYIGFSTSSVPGGWIGSNVSCCFNVTGDAYMGLDGLPLNNQLQATANINGSAPPISTCPNFGFYFTTTDFTGTAHQGGIVGIGDVNTWYDGDEPFSNGGITPVNTSMVDYFFPDNSTTCYLFPPGCLVTFTNQSLNVSLGNDTNLCQGETLTLNAAALNATYLWQDNSSDSTFTVTQQGTYWVNVSNNCGTVIDTILVTYNQLPVAGLGNDTSLCQGDTLHLDVTTLSASYLWQDNSTNPVFNVTQQGTYWVKITTHCDSVTDSIHVSYLSFIPVNLGDDTTFCQGDTLTLNATSLNSGYQWQDNSTSPTFDVTEQGTYWVIVTNLCYTSVDTILIESNNCGTFLEMPNVFTPNNDGINDYFRPIKIENINAATLFIYNRWGQKLFETTNLITGWNGKHNGNVCTDGTYYWIINYTAVTNETKALNGYVTLKK